MIHSQELVKTEAMLMSSVHNRIKWGGGKERKINLVKRFQHQLIEYEVLCSFNCGDIW